MLIELVFSCRFGSFPDLSGFLYELGRTVREGKGVVAIECFHAIELFIGNGLVLSGLANSLC